MQKKPFYKINLVLILLAALFLILSSCSFDIFQKFMEQEDSSETGTLKISINHLSPVVQRIFQDPKLKTRDISDKAYLVADTVYFEVSKNGTLYDAWYEYPGINITGETIGIPQQVTPERDFAPGNYSILVYIYNGNNPYGYPTVYCNKDFTILPGQNTQINLVCIPYSPNYLQEGYYYGLYSLEVSWYNDYQSNTLYPGSEIWFSVQPTSTYTTFGVYPESSYSSQSRPIMLIYDSQGYFINMADPDQSPLGDPLELSMNTIPGATYYIAVIETNNDPQANKSFNMYYFHSEPPPVLEKEVTEFYQWIPDYLNTYQEIWYYFEAVAGRTYAIWWDDSHQGSGNYSADLIVSAYTEDKSTSYFAQVDTGYYNPQNITAAANERIWIKVRDFYGGQYAGTFALRVDGEPAGTRSYIYYITNITREPWAAMTNFEALDTAFGSEGYNVRYFNSLNAAEIFSPETLFVFIDGSDSSYTDLTNFLPNNISIMENWVAEGGRLFINAGPQVYGNLYCGFESYIYSLVHSENVIAWESAHPIFESYIPVGYVYTGDSYAHAEVTGNGLSPILVDNSDTSKMVLAEKSWGQGKFMIGGMTMTYFHQPQPDATNLRANMFSYMAQQ